MAKYRMTFDLHTHTTFRKGRGEEILHATGSVEENVLAAKEKGLSAIGISNHGPGHLTYGLPVDCIPAVRGEVEEARLRHPDIKIYFGVEANIINPSGALDVLQADYSRFDYVMAGYHYGIFGEAPGRAMLIHGGNWLYENFAFVGNIYEKIKVKDQGETVTDLLRQANTDLMVAAVRENRPKVLTHPGDKGPFDIAAIARACAEAGTWMEINNFHRDLTVEGIRTAMKYDVQFVIGSDAHSPERVGCFDKALDRAFEAGLPPERIVNIEEIKEGGQERSSNRCFAIKPGYRQRNIREAYQNRRTDFEQ